MDLKNHKPTPFLSTTEKARIDRLFGAALFDHEIRDRLLTNHDEELLIEFGLAEETRRQVLMLQADTLQQLAQAILNHFYPG